LTYSNNPKVFIHYKLDLNIEGDSII